MIYTEKQMKAKILEDRERLSQERFIDERFREMENRLYALERQLAKLSEEIHPTPARPPMPVDKCVRGC